MRYISSRGGTSPVSAAVAIKMGIAPDGGLFVPENLPPLAWDSMVDLSYKERAYQVMHGFLPEFSEEELRQCISNAYNENNFDSPAIAPLVQLRPGVHILELWHGPTLAFKDMALQILPHLLTTSIKKTDEDAEIVILVATSGDTGKAALEGFKNVKGTRIIVFFPEKGVSEIQKRQMITQEGNNVYVVAVQGNFDDAQNGVKKIFNDPYMAEELSRKNMKMSSANSINWGRLLPQIVYYISAYLDLVAEHSLKWQEKVNIVVPTGNFGNILAAFYAMLMGLPVNRLICASNANNVLTDFIRTGIYDRNRPFYKTISPSMDILISSNLERLLFEITDHDAVLVKGWMEELKNTGRYKVGDSVLNAIQDVFWADHCDDENTVATIHEIWKNDNYLLDTHTAVAVHVYEKYRSETGDNIPTIIASTASPFKFAHSVARAVLNSDKLARETLDEFEVIRLLAEETGKPIPLAIEQLSQKPIRHTTTCSAEEMRSAVLSFLS